MGIIRGKGIWREVMNKIVLIGRLTKDPEITIIEETGKALCKLILAVDRLFKDSNGEKQADFIPIVFWDKKAEIICEYMTKGKMISVSGRLQTSSYEASDGTKRYKAEVIVEDFQFVDSKKEVV